MATYQINGYQVNSYYAGVVQYTIYKDGVEVGTCWDLDTVSRWTNTDVEVVKDEMWKQR